MRHELLSELSDDELAPNDYYPIEYALMWIAYGNKPINLDYAKIVYDEPPKTITGELLKSAERKLITYLRSGKIRSQTIGYEEKDGAHHPTGKYHDIDKTIWNNTFSWYSQTLSCRDCESGNWFEYTDIQLNTNDLLKCTPLSNQPKAEEKKNYPIIKTDLLSIEKETLLKLLLGLALTNYEYDPHAKRNPTAREIADDLQLHGLSVDEDTVRKWLNEAKELLPRDWKKE